MFRMKMSQIDTEIDKNLKNSSFQKFYALFFPFFDRLCDLNVEKGQQGRNMLSSRLF